MSREDLESVLIDVLYDGEQLSTLPHVFQQCRVAGRDDETESETLKVMLASAGHHFKGQCSVRVAKR